MISLLTRRVRSFVIFVIIATIVYCSVLYGTYYDPVAPFSLFNPKLKQSYEPPLVGYLGKSSNGHWSANNDDVIYILQWTQVFSEELPVELMSNCSPPTTSENFRCSITHDRRFLDRSAAVVFHARDLVHTDLPPVKYLNQKYVFYSAESPVLTFAALQGAASTFFDWTMTYRMDSTVYCPYAYFQPIGTGPETNSWFKARTGSTKTGSPELVQNLIETAKRKSKMVLWVVSNCDTHSKRERYVHELRQYVNVDIYGDCGEKCYRNNTYDCMRDLAKDYKFYISFENAVCRDYISEKFGYRLADGLVPIVLRREDYDRMAPHPKSPITNKIENRSRYFFIAANDYASPKELAAYLLYLDSHPDEYLKYFQWRWHWRITAIHRQDCYCNLCLKLYNERQRWRKIRDAAMVRSMMIEEASRNFDIHQWWNVDACDRGMALRLLERGRRWSRFA